MANENATTQISQFVYDKKPDANATRLRLVYTVDNGQLKLRFLRKEK